MKTLQERMKELREKYDLGYKIVADYIKTSETYYYMYEIGRYDLPSRYIPRILNLYLVSADYLFGRTDCPDGLNRYSSRFTGEHTTDEFLAAAFSLDDELRKSVWLYVKFLRGQNHD